MSEGRLKYKGNERGAVIREKIEEHVHFFRKVS